ncbi:hypothetical protein [Halobaculum sp. EA56]|uniref:hypothetical protein n=1 Tax=Halobaculum sp. EA56 TaxID=3421648 RepID=UPI003EBE6A5F
MTEFDVDAVFDATVAPESLRSARQTIEDELGSIEVQVAAQTGAGGRDRIAGRERAMERQLQTQQVDALTDIQGALDEPGAAPAVLDEWDVEHELSERRNEILLEILDQQQESDFDRAKQLGQLGATLGATAALITAGLAGIAGAIPDVPRTSPGAPAPDPNFKPPGGGGSAPVPVAPGGDLTRGPSGDVTFGPDGTPSPKPGPLGDVGPGEVIGGVLAATGIGALTRQLGRGTPSPGASAAAPFALPSILAAQDAQRGGNGERGLLERLFGVNLSKGGGQRGGVAPAAILPFGAARTGARIGREIRQNRAGQQKQKRGGDTSVTVNVDVTGVSERELDQALKQAKNEVLNEVSQGISSGGSGSNRLRR